MRWCPVLALASIAVATGTQTGVGFADTGLSDFYRGVIATLLVQTVIAMAVFLCRCAPRYSRLVGRATLIAMLYPFLRVVYGIVLQLAETAASEIAWTVGIGCIVRLGIGYVMPVVAVTTTEMALWLAFFCVTAAAMVGGRGPLLIGGAAPMLVEQEPILT